jgi:hypothetical protein
LIIARAPTDLLAKAHACHERQGDRHRRSSFGPRPPPVRQGIWLGGAAGANRKVFHRFYRGNHLRDDELFGSFLAAFHSLLALPSAPAVPQRAAPRGGQGQGWKGERSLQVCVCATVARALFNPGQRRPKSVNHHASATPPL